MVRPSPLRTALVLIRERGTELMVPPGSEAAIGALIALGGWEVGLAMPTQVSLVRLGRVLVLAGPAAFTSALEAVRPPSSLTVGVWAALALLTVILACGWIHTALALAADRPVDGTTWSVGLSGAGRALAWNLASLAWIGILGVLASEVGWLAIRTGLSAAAAGDVIFPSVIGLGTAVLWSFVVGSGVYYIAVCLLGAVVAIAEPGTRFWSLFRRAPRVFMAGGGWQGARDVVVLLASWWVVRGLLSQLIVPFSSMHFGLSAMVFGITGSVLSAALAVGDAIILLIVILLGAVVYSRGSATLALPDDPLAAS